jgi:hypothetical protein
MGILFSFSLLMCMILAVIHARYLTIERVHAMRLRIMMIVITSVSGSLYFFVKLLLVFSLIWPILGSLAMIEFSKALLILSGLLWALAFSSSRIYSRVVTLIRHTLSWQSFRDLSMLATRLDHLCPAIVTQNPTPGFLHFMVKSEFYLYRSIIHIMDGKAMLEDIFQYGSIGELTNNWSETDYQTAEQLYQTLQHVPQEEDFWSIVKAYCQASKHIQTAGSPMNLDTAAAS